MKAKKRFIAGAICPQCKAQDSIFVSEQNQIEVVQCVECSYLEQRLDEEVQQKVTTGGDVIGLFKPE